MATIGVDPNGRKRVLFFASDGKRKTVRLGDVPMRVAEGIKGKVEEIVRDLTIGRPHDVELSKWIHDLDPKMRKRLERAGLVSGNGRADMALSPFLDEHLRGLSVKESTRVMYAQTKRCLVGYFGAGRIVRTIGPADGDRFRQWLIDHEKLSAATVAKRIVVARQFFKRARKWRLVDENPFAEVVAGAQVNKARMYFVSREVSQKVLDACPDTQWKLLFALSRYGGLRCPSEHLGLKWADVDWDKGRIVVHSPKTERHEGGECRIIPMFPELRPLLEAAWAEAEEGGSPYIITRYREKSCNLRTQLQRILKRAGVKPWPKLFQNLRSTRETELAERFPIQAVCSWIGNSEAVARKHYLQLIDEHFEAASRDTATEAAAEKAARNPARPTQEPEGVRGKAPNPETAEPAAIPAGSSPFLPPTDHQVSVLGLEPRTL